MQKNKEDDTNDLRKRKEGKEGSRMKKRILAILCAVTMACSSGIVSTPVYSFAQESTTGTTYYVSSINGNNKNSGTEQNKAWETLDKLNGLQLQPGDKILLEAGSIFDGYIHLKDVHGENENPIVISSYGDGAKPIIQANGDGIWYQDYGKVLDNAYHKYKGYVSSAILLYDVDYVEISNLEITNHLPDGEEKEWNRLEQKNSERMDRTGVAGVAKDGGTMEHVYLDNLYIHDVTGNLQDKHMNNGGIQMNAFKPKNELETGIARYDDIKITNCKVEQVSRAGIVVGYTYQHDKFSGGTLDDKVVKKYGHTNILMENNYIKDPGNDALVVMYSYQPMIQNNVSDGAGNDLVNLDQYPNYWQAFCATIWPWKCKDAIFQHNEAFDTKGPNGDGQAWDIDWSDGTIFQYNYSHNNFGGAFLICLNEAVNGVFRYNLSQNDLKSFITFQGNPVGKVYNNVFYVDGDRETRIYHPDAGKNTGKGELYNNIFYNASSANPNDSWTEAHRTYSNNLYYGYTSVPTNDEHAFIGISPENTETSIVTKAAETAKQVEFEFVNPGSAPKTTDGVIHQKTEFEGYKVPDNSPVINAGIYIPDNGGKDFFGNPLNGMTPDIGIYESKVADKEVLDIFSSIYTISKTDKTIKNVAEKTTVAKLLSNLNYSSGITCTVWDKETEKKENDVVTSGMTLKVSNSKEVLEFTITVDAKSEDEIKISSFVYEISGTVIDQVAKQTTVSAFLLNLEYETNITCTVWDGDTQKTGNDMIVDGMKLKATNGKEIVEFTIKVPKTFTEYVPTGMTAEVGSFQPNNATEGNGNLALDNNTNTVWHTAWAGCAREDCWITIDMKESKKIEGLKYVPRLNGNNGIITEFKVEVSEDGKTFTPVEEMSTSTWEKNNKIKYVYFKATDARYVKLTALNSLSSEAGKIFASAAEIRLGILE